MKSCLFLQHSTNSLGLPSFPPVNPFLASHLSPCAQRISSSHALGISLNRNVWWIWSLQSQKSSIDRFLVLLSHFPLGRRAGRSVRGAPIGASNERSPGKKGEEERRRRRRRRFASLDDLIGCQKKLPQEYSCRISLSFEQILCSALSRHLLEHHLRLDSGSPRSLLQATSTQHVIKRTN